MDAIRTLDQADAFLSSLIIDPPRPYAERDPGLACVREMLRRLGNPHHGQQSLHIAGSKGKGSTALFAESILRAAGLRVGSFTSPHLQRWTERFRIDGREIRPERFVELAERVRLAVAEIRTAAVHGKPTFFDALTAMALLLFHEEKVDVSILETGLGGRLDSTNVVRPAVACITSIELEHTDKLGSTLAQIAAEKAGIIKSGTPTVVGHLPGEALAVIEAEARRHDAKLLRLGKEFQMRSAGGDLTGLVLTTGKRELAACVRVMGEHFAADAALAAMCVRVLDVLDHDRWGDACQVGLSKTVLPGRVEMVQRAPWVVIDSSHTEASAAALARVLAGLPAKQRCFVVSFSGRKNLEAIGVKLFPAGCSVIVTEAERTRSIPAADIARRLAANAAVANLVVDRDPVSACTNARSRLTRDDLLCVTGSAYMAGVAREVLLPRATAGAGQDPCPRLSRRRA